MSPRGGHLLSALLIVTPFACESAGDHPDAGVPEDLGVDAGPAGLPPRPAVQTCRFDGTPEGAVPRQTAKPAFIDAFSSPSSFGVSDPDRLILGDEQGQVLLVEPRARTSSLALDLSGDRIDAIVVRPGELFALHRPRSAPTRLRLSRFVTNAGGIADDDSQRVLLDLESPEAKGALSFDADAHLLVAISDGGDPSSAQDLSRLEGSVLRLDVSAVDSTGSYRIPPDNPFVGRVGLREEIWAYGFQSPRDCILDERGAVLCVDAAGSGQQELNRLIAGGNYGWPQVQGHLCQPAGGACDDPDLLAPLVAHPLAAGDCGAVGGALLEDGSAYVFADRCSGRLFGLRRPIDFFGEVESLGRVEEGLVRVVRAGTGDLWALGVSGPLFELQARQDARPFPARLSESGCFVDLEMATPGPDLIPFDVSSALWTDGAVKRRWMVVPPDETIIAAPEGPWTFPVGSILIKEFAFDVRDASAPRRRPVETRVMIKTEDGWDFHSYRWNEAGTDAELLSASLLVDIDVELMGQVTSIAYLFPSRFDCKVCHGPATTGALGPVSMQMDRRRDYGSASASQLEMLHSIGVIDRVSPSPAPLVDPADETVDLERRARSYLHANCAHCHRPGGWVPPDLDMDLRFERSLEQARICGVVSSNSGPNDAGSFRIAPGQPEDSTVYGRMIRRDNFQMPPLATSQVDATGERVLRAWIEQLAGCP